jgi:hypothetical protein
MAYAKMKAATPANAARMTEPCTLDADPVKVDGVAVAAGAVTLCAYEIVPVEEGAALVVAARVGVTVWVTVKTVGTQVEMVKTVTGAEVTTPAEVEATTTAEVVGTTTTAEVVGTTAAEVVQLVEVLAYTLELEMTVG